MLDGWAKRKVEPFLIRLAAPLASIGISSNAITIAGCLIGVLAAVAAANAYFWLALVLVLASRLFDGLDGAVARIVGTTDYGGYLDIVLDFFFYGAFPLGFVFLDPASNAVAGAVLVFSFYVNGASFLAYAIMAEKHGHKTTARGSKSIYFTTGLAEASETTAVFAAFCLLPQWFAPLAWIFAFICFYTAFSRIIQAAAAFRN